MATRERELDIDVDPHYDEVKRPAPMRRGLVPEGLADFPLPVKPGVQPYMWVDAPNIGVSVDTKYLPLYRAAYKGDWKGAASFFKGHPEAVNARISIFSMTALHVAAGQQHWQFVEKLVDMVDSRDLEMQDLGGYTALHYAAKAGCIQAVTKMVQKNSSLTQIASLSDHVPLHVAAGSSTSPGQKEVVRFLASVTQYEGPNGPFGCPRGCELLWGVVAAEYLDIASSLLKRHEHLATHDCPVAGYILAMLTSTPSAFKSQSRLGFWESLIYPFVLVQPNNGLLHTENSTHDQHPRDIEAAQTTSYSASCINQVPSIKRVHDEKLKHKNAVQLVEEVCKQVSKSSMTSSEILNLFLNHSILANAAKKGIVEILTTCVEFFPDLLWFTSNKETILQISIKFRQEKIFNLMRDVTAQNKMMACHISHGGDTALHMAARLAPPTKLKSVSGTALQMQREIQWFKAVEKLIHPNFKGLSNDDGRTAQELFTKEHKELLESGEKWMKDTSNSCMLVAALIATVVFAAAFQVPGGNRSDTGVPFFLKRTSFMIFIVSDALALFSSTTSILMFLSILTSRFAEQDFLESLPKRLIIGLASLFFAIATMMVAFGATLSIVLEQRLKWVSIPVTLLACFPVGLFAMLQLPLFLQMVKSTFWSDISRPNGKRKYLPVLNES
ncbi:hypothetical protein Ancab_016584 [Ancistrocladus abbreviatus]